MSNLFPLLPAFLDMTGRAAVLLSAEATLASLAGRLMDGGAAVTAIDRTPSEAMAATGVRLVRRRWRAADMVGAALVVAGAGEPRRLRARAAAKAAKAIFYMPGEPDLSDVGFGAAGGQGPLAIAVAAARLPRAVETAVMRRIEAAVPEGYAGFLTAAAALEAEVQAALEARALAAFWSDAAEAAFAARPSDWAAWLKARLAG